MTGSATSAPAGTTCSTSATGSSCRASTSALYCRFSSRRRSCHSPRSTITTTEREHRDVGRMIHLGCRTKRQLTSPTVGVGHRRRHTGGGPRFLPDSIELEPHHLATVPGLRTPARRQLVEQVQPPSSRAIRVGPAAMPAGAGRHRARTRGPPSRPPRPPAGGRLACTTAFVTTSVTSSSSRNSRSPSSFPRAPLSRARAAPGDAATPPAGPSRGRRGPSRRWQPRTRISWTSRSAGTRFST